MIYGESGWTQLAIRNINLLGSGGGCTSHTIAYPPLIARVDAEENLLRALFGDEYNAYCSHTWRLIPGLYYQIRTGKVAFLVVLGSC